MRHGLDDTLYVYDLGNVTRMYRGWKVRMASVLPVLPVLPGQYNRQYIAFPIATLGLWLPGMLHKLLPSVAYYTHKHSGSS